MIPASAACRAGRGCVKELFFVNYENARVLLDLVSLGIGFLLVPVFIAIAWYVLSSIAHLKALKRLNYANAWLAWIPFGRWFALADCLDTDTAKPCGVAMAMRYFRFWWLVQFFIGFVPTIGPIASFVLVLLCLGWTYTAVYAALDGRSESDMAPLGYLSAIFGIIPVVKFFCLPKREG